MRKAAFLILLVVLGIGLFPAASAQNTVEITFTHIFTDDLRKAEVQKLVDEFMAQNPGIVVNVQAESDDYGQVFDAALLAASQGNAPHVVQVEDTLSQLAIDSTYFIKLSDYATADELATVSDILPAIRNYYGMDTNEFWGVPWNSSNPLLYYNREMFEQAGLDPDSPPTTFAELMTACEAIMSANIEGLTACANWPVTSWFTEQWLSMEGVLFANNDNGRSGRVTEVLWDTPEMLGILSWWKDMADKGYFTYTGSTEAYTGEAITFLSKGTAIHITSTAGLTNLLSFSQAQGFTLGIAQLIKPTEESNNGVTAGGAALFVTAGHPDAEIQAAVDFVFFMTSTDSIVQWHKGTGYLPNRQSAVDILEAEGWFEANPPFRIALNQLLSASESNPANAGAIMGPYGQVRDVHNEAVQSMIDGGSAPEEALAAAKVRADQLIKDYNSVIGE
ncbi:MAG: ABC transporter substrate-binding protein [Anaerolineae bacterium]|nr:MAG: ABC transporter substrate-binding protein [Anaerolineae bacterium]